jgi:hypothetical protein
MKIRTLSLTALALLFCGVAQAVTQVFVDEDFEDYADTASVLSVWSEQQGAINYNLIDQNYLTYISNKVPLTEYPLGQKAFDPASTGATGKGLEFFGAGVLELNLATLNNGQPLLPTAEQSVVVAGDIFDVGAYANKKRSIGLRSSSANTDNIIEMGMYNDASSSYAARITNFGITAETPTNPNWVMLPLDPALDGPDTGSGISPFDIGQAWHHYKAVITPTTITITLDLKRDQLNNATGAAGVDVTYSATLTTSSAGFDKIRFGGPSGNPSAGANGYGGVVFDNLYVALEDVAVAPPTLVGDFNNDGFVNAADYTVWRDTLGSTTDFRADADNDGDIDGPGVGTDYEFWVNNYGAVAAPATSLTIPEPTSLALVALGLVAAARRR